MQEGYQMQWQQLIEAMEDQHKSHVSLSKMHEMVTTQLTTAEELISVLALSNCEADKQFELSKAVVDQTFLELNKSRKKYDDEILRINDRFETEQNQRSYDKDVINDQLQEKTTKITKAKKQISEYKYRHEIILEQKKHAIVTLEARLRCETEMRLNSQLALEQLVTQKKKDDIENKKALLFAQGERDVTMHELKRIQEEVFEKNLTLEHSNKALSNTNETYEGKIKKLIDTHNQQQDMLVGEKQKQTDLFKQTLTDVSDKFEKELVTRNKLVCALKGLQDKRLKEIKHLSTVKIEKQRLEKSNEVYKVKVTSLEKSHKETVRQGKLFRREIEALLQNETDLRVNNERNLDVVKKEHDKVVIDLKAALAAKVELEIVNKRLEMQAVVNKESWQVENDKFKGKLSEEVEVRKDLEHALDYFHHSFQKRALKWVASRKVLQLEMESLRHKQEELIVDIQQREQDVIEVTAFYESKIEESVKGEAELNDNGNVEKIDMKVKDEHYNLAMVKNELEVITAERDKTISLLKRLSRKHRDIKKTLNNQNTVLQNKVVALKGKVDKRAKRTLEALALCNLHKDKLEVAEVQLEVFRNSKSEPRNRTLGHRVANQVKQQQDIENMVLDVRKEEEEGCVAP